MIEVFLETALFYLQIVPIDLQIEIFLEYILISGLSYHLFVLRCLRVDEEHRRFNFFDVMLAVFFFVVGIFAITMAIFYGVLMAWEFSWLSLLFMIVWLLWCAPPAFLLAVLTFPPLPKPDLNPEDFDGLDGGNGGSR